MRGLAILAVLFYHYITAIGAPSQPLWGLVTTSTRLFWSGVDLFFVLSGYLIAGILMDSAGSPNYFRTFYLRRIHRIFPLYFFWLALLCGGVAVNLDARFGAPIFRGAVPLWFYPLFLQNNAPLWLNAAPPIWMAMSWSLAVEEQFYVLLPSVVRFISRRALGVLCSAVLLLSPLYRVWLVAGHPGIHPGWAFGTFSRLDGLAMGVGIAILVRNRECWHWLKWHTRFLSLGALGLALGFLGLTYGRAGDVSIAAYGITLFAAQFGVWLLLALLQSNSQADGFLRHPMLQYFGKLSYAVYILHQGVHALTEVAFPVWHRYNAVRVLAVVGVSTLLTVGLAEVSWRVMEHRLIQRAHARYRY